MKTFIYALIVADGGNTHTITVSGNKDKLQAIANRLNKYHTDHDKHYEPLYELLSIVDIDEDCIEYKGEANSPMRKEVCKKRDNAIKEWHENNPFKSIYKHRYEYYYVYTVSVR